MNHYQTLSIAEDAHPKVINAAYLAMSKIYHPDAKTAHSSTTKMQEINLAFEVLKDPIKRDNYDRIHGFGKYAKHRQKDSKPEHKERTTQSNNSSHQSNKQKDNEEDIFVFPDFSSALSKIMTSTINQRFAFFVFLFLVFAMFNRSYATLVVMSVMVYFVFPNSRLQRLIYPGILLFSAYMKRAFEHDTVDSIVWAMFISIGLYGTYLLVTFLEKRPNLDKPVKIGILGLTFFIVSVSAPVFVQELFYDGRGLGF